MKRDASRTRIGGEFEAEVQFSDPSNTQYRKILTARGRIDDLGAKGIFLNTQKDVPLNQPLDIRILFEPKIRDGLSMEAQGIAMRKTTSGVGIRFTEIDVGRLGECVLEMLNRK